jgi:transcriptional regulator with XRE-family HTH domain
VYDVVMTQDTERFFGAKVRQLREVLGLKQSEFAARLTAAGLSFTQQQVARLEVAGRPIRLNEAPVIAQVLGVELHVLLPGFWSVEPETDDDDRRAREARAVESTKKVEAAYAESLEHLRAIEKILVEGQRGATARLLEIKEGGATRETTKAARRNNKAKAGER